MAEHQGRQRSHVLASDVEAALASGASAPGQNQVLAGARAGAPPNPPLHVLSPLAIVQWARRAHQTHCIINHIWRGGDLGDGGAKSQDFIAQVPAAPNVIDYAVRL